MQRVQRCHSCGVDVEAQAQAGAHRQTLQVVSVQRLTQHFHIGITGRCAAQIHSSQSWVPPKQLSQSLPQLLAAAQAQLPQQGPAVRRQHRHTHCRCCPCCRCRLQWGHRSRGSGQRCSGLGSNISGTSCVPSGQQELQMKWSQPEVAPQVQVGEFDQPGECWEGLQARAEQASCGLPQRLPG